MKGVVERCIVVVGGLLVVVVEVWVVGCGGQKLERIAGYL
jgi:hypothetical protein